MCGVVRRAGGTRHGPPPARAGYERTAWASMRRPRPRLLHACHAMQPPHASLPRWGRCLQDQRGALTAAEVCQHLGMPELRGRQWHVQAAVATKGEGLYEGLDWLSNTVSKQPRAQR